MKERVYGGKHRYRRVMLDFGGASIGAADQSLDLLDLFLSFSREPLAETSRRMVFPFCCLQAAYRRLVVSQF